MLNYLNNVKKGGGWGVGRGGVGGGGDDAPNRLFMKGVKFSIF